MKFKLWIEENKEPAQASAEVIRTGLQPQVGNYTTPIMDNDPVLAIDGQIQRLGEISNRCGGPIKEFIKEVIANWNSIRKVQSTPSQKYIEPNKKEVDYMKSNQPLPTKHQIGNGPGTMGNF